jgi:hypothetical protein
MSPITVTVYACAAGEEPMSAKRCEHRDCGDTCPSRAVFHVSRGRRHDAQDSCRRHLAATAEALAEGTARPVIVTVLAESEVMSHAGSGSRPAC